VAEHLPSKHEVLSSNPHTPPSKKEPTMRYYFILSKMAITTTTTTIIIIIIIEKWKVWDPHTWLVRI
jgi:hypothetical protein